MNRRSIFPVVALVLIAVFVFQNDIWANSDMLAQKTLVTGDDQALSFQRFASSYLNTEIRLCDDSATLTTVKNILQEILKKAHERNLKPSDEPVVEDNITEGGYIRVQFRAGDEMIFYNPNPVFLQGRVKVWSVGPGKRVVANIQINRYLRQQILVKKDTANATIRRLIDAGRCVDVFADEGRIRLRMISRDPKKSRAPPVEIKKRFAAHNVQQKFEEARKEPNLLHVLNTRENFRNLSPVEKRRLTEKARKEAVTFILGEVFVDEAGGDFSHVRTCYSEHIHHLGYQTIWIGEILFHRMTPIQRSQWLLEEAQHLLHPPQFINGAWDYIDGYSDVSQNPDTLIRHDPEFGRSIDLSPTTPEEHKRFPVPEFDLAGQTEDFEESEKPEPPSMKAPPRDKVTSHGPFPIYAELHAILAERRNVKDLEREISHLLDRDGQAAFASLLVLVEEHSATVSEAADEIYKFMRGFIDEAPQLLRTYPSPSERLNAIKKKLKDLHGELGRHKRPEAKTAAVLRNMWAWYCRTNSLDKTHIGLTPEFAGSYSLRSLPKGIKTFRIEAFRPSDDKLIQEWERWIDGHSEYPDRTPVFYDWIHAVRGESEGYKLLSIDGQGKRHIEGWVLMGEILGEGLMCTYSENAPWNRFDNPRRIKGVASVLRRRIIEESIRRGYHGIYFSIPSTDEGKKFNKNFGAERGYEPITQYGKVGWSIVRYSPVKVMESNCWMRALARANKKDVAQIIALFIDKGLTLADMHGKEIHPQEVLAIVEQAPLSLRGIYVKRLKPEHWHAIYVKPGKPIPAGYRPLSVKTRSTSEAANVLKPPKPEPTSMKAPENRMAYVEANAKDMIPRLVNALMAWTEDAKREGDEKVLLLDIPQLKSEKVKALIDDCIMKYLHRIDSNNVELAQILKNLTIAHSKDIVNIKRRLSAEQNPLKPENVIIVTNSPEREEFKTFGQSFITAINDADLGEDIAADKFDYYPLAELAFFSVLRATGCTRGGLWAVYNRIPNVRKIDETKFFSLIYETDGVTLRKIITVNLEPIDKFNYNDLKTLYEREAVFIRNA